MALGGISLLFSVMILHCSGSTQSNTWIPTSIPISAPGQVFEINRDRSSRAVSFSSTMTLATSTTPESRVSEFGNHQDVTSSGFHSRRRDGSSRAMQTTVTYTMTPTEAGVTEISQYRDATANSFYPSRRDWSKHASEDNSDVNNPVTAQNPTSRRDYYPTRRERPQQNSQKAQESVKLPGGAAAAAAAGLTKPMKYHYYPHNQHIYLLPECAVQQVCNAVYVRLNFTQPLCACPSRYRDPCSASINTDDLHTTELITDPRGKALTLVKTCEPVAEMRECRAPRDWSLLALQNIRTGKSHYLIICRCPPTNILEGPMSHDQPTYASVPGIRVYGMMCAQVNNRRSRGRHPRFIRSSIRSAPPFPWRKVHEMVSTIKWDE